MTSTRFSFASDNHAGMHPQVLAALSEANVEHSGSYGLDDEWTEATQEKFRSLFGEEAITHFVFSGTSANVLALQTMIRPHHAVLCADVSHLNVDETGAPEAIIGCKLIPMPTVNGKFNANQIDGYLLDVGDMHRSQPRVISITQATEYGTVYSVDEIRSIAEVAHRAGLYVHMDGARIANAAASLSVTLREMTVDAGVDVLSFGGCKNGMAIGEAVVFFRPELAADFPYIRKQGLNLSSKMRFIAAQFLGLLNNDLWLRNAQHANEMAELLTQQLDGVSNIHITQPVQSNAVFATLPIAAIVKLQEEYDFYIWNPKTNEVRWMTAFDTQPDDATGFANRIKEVVANLS